MNIIEAEQIKREAISQLKQYKNAIERFIYNSDNERQRGELLGRLFSVERQLSKAFPWYSQAGQDKWIDDNIFRGKRGGVFLDIGAYDGITGSNSLFFEKFLGWEGLLVEASPHLSAKAENVRSQPVASCAAGSNDGVSSFIAVTNGYTQMGGLEEHFEESTLSILRSHSLHKERIIEVHVKSASTLIREYGLNDIDVVFIDVEGAEKSVLSGFPFDTEHPAVFCIENNNRDNTILNVLGPKGYDRVAFVGVDEIFLSREKAYLYGHALK